ncbi:hypothetical protein [Algivirga pacifica]|uniref:hypothetical protein n=1 Tax=Algivirga pacifica TaxID=1162670 RepID=UPI0031EA4E2B
MRKPEKPAVCEMCKRKFPLTFHHLIPRSNHRNKWFKKNFTKEDMTHRGIWVCKPCHKHIHQTFSEKVLGREYNTLEKLMSHEEIHRFVAWLQKRG